MGIDCNCLPNTICGTTLEAILMGMYKKIPIFCQSGNPNSHKSTLINLKERIYFNSYDKKKYIHTY